MSGLADPIGGRVDQFNNCDAVQVVLSLTGIPGIWLVQLVRGAVAAEATDRGGPVHRLFRGRTTTVS